MHKQRPQTTERARERRSAKTEPESLLWYALRGRRLSGLKFRREYPIEPYIVDFVCLEHRLVIEIDGAYHDIVVEQDLQRQRRIESRGWRIIRFANEDVMADVDAVAIAIARECGVEPKFRGRSVDS